MILLGLFLTLVFLYALVSRRVERSIVTGPMAFTAAGILVVQFLRETGLPHREPGMFLHLAEIGLVLLLFTDASRTNLAILKNVRNLPARLLSVGMLLTLLLGAVVARLIFPQLSLWEVGILAAILVPTDAGLGEIVVSSPRVPVKIRQALKVEAGLNDGLSVPFLLFFMALAEISSGGEYASLTKFIVEQLGFGALVGAGVGLTGGVLLGAYCRRTFMAESWQQLGVVALPLLCVVISTAVGASMFIAAFVAGLVVQVGFKPAGERSVEFTEGWGRLISLSVFFLFGIIVAGSWPQFNPMHGLYAILSLTAVRMGPVAVSLLGTGLNRTTILFMGWFGPRGLASIVLGLVYLGEQRYQPEDATTRLTVTATVLLSIFAHGISSRPGIELYARKIANLNPNAAELGGAEGKPPEQALDESAQNKH